METTSNPTTTYTILSAEWDGSPSKTYTIELDATVTGNRIKFDATQAVNEIREAAGLKALNYGRVKVQGQDLLHDDSFNKRIAENAKEVK